ncbi:MAG TPA: ABC transporter ATP-binding protein [Gammaproteobacteria bacterium]
MTVGSGKSVTIRGLTKCYADVVALQDVSLDIDAGEFCTLLGASGSGKTTLLKVIAGFEAHADGVVEIGGRDVGKMPVAARNIGMVFQNYALFPHMSVYRNVAFGLEMRRLPATAIEQRVQEALARVRLTALGERLPAELSGGQQQRVALARALVIDPDILLMDEPLGALDKNLRQAIQLELKQLHRELGVTIVYVTHDQEEALHLSDRIVILEQGRVIQAGTPRELYFQPANAFVAGFLGECNFLVLDDGSEVGLRPEALSVAAPGQDGGKRIALEVETTVFTGTGVKLIGRHAGRQVVALLGNDALAEPPAAGSRVELSFDDNAIMRF